MKILYLHQYFATPSSKSGTRSYEMSKRFVKNGHDVTFVTSSAYLSDEFNLNSGWNYLEFEGIKLHVLNLNYSNNDGFAKRIFKFINFSIRSTFKALTIKSDVVFATSTPLTIAVPGLVYSKVKTKPLVFEVRDLWPELPVATGVIKNRLVISFAKWLEKYTYRNSTRLVGLSPGMCDGIAKQGVSRSKITLATNSCDTDLFDVDSKVGENYINSNFDFLNGRKLIVYTGTFGLINNVGFLVEIAKEAVNIAPELCFVAIGDGMEKKEIIEQATSAGVLNNNLYILPAVPKTEVVKILSAADLSLSLFGPVKEMWNNSANKLFDSLASQTPVAINYGGWQKKFILESKCGIVLDYENYNDSVASIKNFLFNAQAYSLAKDSCRLLSYERFSRDIMAEKLESTILDACND